MKKFFAIFGALLVVSCVVLFLIFGRAEEASIIVATDSHYLSSRVNDGGKAFTDMLYNSDGKLVQYCDEIFSAFSDDVIEQNPDVLILSGDLTFNGERASHEGFVKKLDAIRSAGVQVLAIAGNHDIDRSSVGFKDEEYERVENINADDFKDMYYNFGMAQAESVDEHSLSYLYKVNRSLYVLMLDTNAYGQNFVQDESYEWIENQLKMVKKAHAQVITVSHQNLFAHNEQLSFGYQLYDADELLELLNQYKVKCHLSGHIHMQHIKTDGVNEIVTESLLVAPVQYGVIDFDGNINYQTRTVDVSSWAKKNGSDNADLLNFDTYASGFFKTSGTSRTMQKFEESDLSDEDKMILADTFGELNLAYFSGKKYDTAPLQDGIEIWKKQDEFTSKYITNMTDEAQYDYNFIKIK